MHNFILFLYDVLIASVLLVNMKYAIFLKETTNENWAYWSFCTRPLNTKCGSLWFLYENYRKCAVYFGFSLYFGTRSVQLGVYEGLGLIFQDWEILVKFVFVSEILAICSMTHFVRICTIMTREYGV